MRRHITDHPRTVTTGTLLVRFLQLERRNPDRRIIARMRARKGQAGPSRLTQYLRIARGLRA